MKDLLHILGDALRDVGHSCKEAFEGLFTTENHELDAGFGSPRKLLSRRNKGLCIDGLQSISLQQNCSNTITIAPSGSGKSQVLALPTLLQADGSNSFIVNDPSKELAESRGYLQSAGYKTLVLDFSKKTGFRFNPMGNCSLHDGTIDIGYIKKMAMTVVSANAGNEMKKDFWTGSAISWIACFMEYCIENEPKENHNLAFVYSLFQDYQGAPETVEEKIVAASESVYKKFRALAGASENTRKSQLATCLDALSFIGDDPVLREITSGKTNIEWQAFREKSHALFVQVNPSDIKYYEPILSLLYQNFFRFAFAEVPSSDEALPISLIFDEFDTCGAISDYASIISLSRKYKIAHNIFLQSKNQLSRYKEQAGTILSNCSVKVYFGGLTIDEASELERTLGKYEYKPDPESSHTKERSLMTAQEIREMKEIIVLVRGEEPLMLKTKPAWKNRTLQKRLAIPFVEVPEKDTDSAVTREMIELYLINEELDSEFIFSADGRSSEVGKMSFAKLIDHFTNVTLVNNEIKMDMSAGHFVYVKTARGRSFFDFSKIDCIQALKERIEDILEFKSHGSLAGYINI